MYTMITIQTAIDRLTDDPIGYTTRAISRLEYSVTHEERWYYYGFYRIVSDRMGGNPYALRICKAIEELNTL